MDLNTLRTALLITLSIILVVVLWRRFRQWVRMRDVPALLHAELEGLEVLYHPARLHVQLSVPEKQDFELQVLDRDHAPVHQLERISLGNGRHVLEYALPELADGLFYLEVRTHTQRTERQFRLQQA